MQTSDSGLGGGKLAPASTPTAGAQAMVLAAGRGERMRPLTDHCPKPLLEVHGRSLLEHHLHRLWLDGCQRVLINTAWLGDQIEARLGLSWPEVGDGAQRTSEGAQRKPSPPGAGLVRPSLQLTYSHEGRDFGGALETAGGIARALPRLDDVFWLVAGDVYAPQFTFDADARARFAASDALGHLFLVPNPPHNPKGDFALDAQGFARNDEQGRWTYSTIALLRRELFEAWGDATPGNPKGLAGPLAPILRQAADKGRVSAQIYHGPWTDVGTPQRLKELNTP